MNDFEKKLIELWEQYSKSRNWWNPEDVTFRAFIGWLQSGKPNQPNSPNLINKKDDKVSEV
jgi:hypothetical protein